MGKERKNEVFLDLDDTLIGTSSSIIRRLEILLGQYPVKEGLFYIHNLISNSQRETILSKRYEFSEDFWAEYERLRRNIRPKPIGNIKGRLDKLKEDAPLGILTNASRNKIEEALESMGLTSNYFECGTYGRDDLQFLKPDIRCLNEIGPKNSLVYVGDDARDYLLSREAGIPFLAVCTGLTSRETFVYLGQDEKRIFPSIQEVSLNGI